MAHKVYDNFVLQNEIEDQYNSHLDLSRFCTIDNSLVGTAGMKKMVHKYTATDGTEKLTMGQGNSKEIDVSFTEQEYEILLAQNHFQYYDEQEMRDPKVVETGIIQAGAGLYNIVNADIYAALKEATLEVNTTAFNFDAFADAQAKLKLENLENISIYALVHPDDMASLRKSLKETLQYVQAFAVSGYVGTVAGVNLYVKKDATPGTVTMATNEAVTLFLKKGVEVEQDRDQDHRLNHVYSRKYYLAALTNATKAVKIIKSA